MGNINVEACCNKRGDFTPDQSYGPTLKGGHDQELQRFMDQYSVNKIQSNCNGGIVENYVCVEVAEFGSSLKDPNQKQKKVRKLM